jgi:hypothetical protein
VDAIALLETLTQDGPSLPPRFLDNAAAIESYLSSTLRRCTPVLALPPIPTDLAVPLTPYFQDRDTTDAMDKLLQGTRKDQADMGSGVGFMNSHPYIA